MPDLESPFYGGINTALRIADHLRRTHGVANQFVVAADPNEGFVRSAVAAAFPGLADAPITFIDDPADVHRAPPVDVAIATLWETAYLLAHAPGARRKAYLVQDYEPVFYPRAPGRRWPRSPIASACTASPTPPTSWISCDRFDVAGTGVHPGGRPPCSTPPAGDHSTTPTPPGPVPTANRSRCSCTPDPATPATAGSSPPPPSPS
jgi:hypothetical protein